MGSNVNYITLLSFNQIMVNTRKITAALRPNLWKLVLPCLTLLLFIYISAQYVAIDQSLSEQVSAILTNSIIPLAIFVITYLILSLVHYIVLRVRIN